MCSGTSFSLPLSQQQIADALGITTVHVSRTARVLREEGVLTLRDRRATIHNVDELRAAACISTGAANESRPLV